MIDIILAKNKVFQVWQAEDRDSFVPPFPAGQLVKKRRSRRRADSPPSASDAADQRAVTSP